MKHLLNTQSQSQLGQIEHNFRLFYNHTLYPELQRMEHLRVRLLVLLFGSVILFIAIIATALSINVLAFTFALAIPIGFYITYLIYRVQVFKNTFKPRVINLLMDFIDDLPNVQHLQYESKLKIKQDEFVKSGIFVQKPVTQYKGEDYIYGQIGELEFELCELSVRDMSKVRTRLNYVFQGFFLHAKTKFPTDGRVLVIPKEFHKYLNRSIRNFTAHCGQRITKGLDPLFDELFITYANKDALFVEPLTSEKQVRYFFPASLQYTIAKYRQLTGKDIYASFQGQDLYIAIAEPSNMLEPNIIFSNVDYQLVKQFMEDILLVLLLVNKLDETH